MLLQHRRPRPDGDTGTAPPWRVVAVTDRAWQGLGEAGDAPDLGVLGRRRVGERAGEHRVRVAAGRVVYPVERPVDLVFVGGTGRQDDPAGERFRYSAH